MKKWQLILCSLGICFVPMLGVLCNYIIFCVTMGMPMHIIPFLALPFGLYFSYLIYRDNIELTKD